MPNGVKLPLETTGGADLLVRPHSSDSALSAGEVALVWRGDGISPSSHLTLKLLIATGQRVEEVLQAPWDEFDLNENLWVIPRERRKNRNTPGDPHVVPLNDGVLAGRALAGFGKAPLTRPMGAEPRCLACFDQLLMVN